MRFSSLLFLLCTLLALGAPALGDIFVRNRPFRGEVESRQGDYWVALAPLAQALGLDLQGDSEKGWIVGSGSRSPGTVTAGGQSLPVVAGAGGSALVNLQPFCRLVGARVVVNRKLGTVDVYAAGLEELAAADTPRKTVERFLSCFERLPALTTYQDFQKSGREIELELEAFEAAVKGFVPPGTSSGDLLSARELATELARTLKPIASVPPDSWTPDQRRRVDELIAAWERLRHPLVHIDAVEDKGEEATVHAQLQWPWSGKDGKPRTEATLFLLKRVKGLWYIEDFSDVSGLR